MRLYQFFPILIGLLLLTVILPAQQTPFLNHYTWNPRLFNPASQGADGKGNITAVYRSQFQNLEATDRPNTYLLHGDFSPWLDDRIGLAAQVMGDKAHLISRFQLGGFFSYHLIQKRNIRFSLGVAASFLNQSFDFDGVRVSDIVDLAVFSSQMNNTQFDGGPGLAFQYRTHNGSIFSIDAAASQIFSSDIVIDNKNNTATSPAIYDMIPHALVNARYRYQGAGFAVEPNIAFRAFSSEKPVNAGVFDLNLNAYFLKDDRLMVGGGVRTDGGGIHLQIGVAPTKSVSLVISAEHHTALGTSYEVGATYSFKKAIQIPSPVPDLPPEPQEILLEKDHKLVMVLTSGLLSEFTGIQNQHAAISNNITAANTTRSRKVLVLAADSCTSQLGQTFLDIESMRQSVKAIDSKRLQAEQLVLDAQNSGANISSETRGYLQIIKEQNAAVNTTFNEITRRQQSLQQQCSGMKPAFTEIACIQIGDPDCIRELSANALAAAAGTPGNLFPLQSFVNPGTAAITYHYPDDTESYMLTPETKALAAHLVLRIKDMQAQGLQLEGIALITELQEDLNTLGYQLGTAYGGELGDTQIAYSLVDNATKTPLDQNLSIASGSVISLETLGALKIGAIQQYLTEQGIPAGLITLQVRYNNAGNIYREETKVVLHIRN